jgi:hypothetical protein
MKGAFLYLGMLVVVITMSVSALHKPRASEAEIHKATMEDCMLIAENSGNDLDACLTDPVAAINHFLGE